MTFDKLNPGDSVFLDANIFVYHFAPIPQLGSSCDQLMKRLDSQEVFGVTSTHVVTEVAHRLMTIEAAAVLGRPQSAIVRHLQSHCDDIQKLGKFRTAVEIVLNSKIGVLPIFPQLTLAAATASQQFGLLSNDAMIVAVMQANGLVNLASNDADFDRVPVKRYSPI